jgi:hypothetical protein
MSSPHPFVAIASRAKFSFFRPPLLPMRAQCRQRATPSLRSNQGHNSMRASLLPLPRRTSSSGTSWPSRNSTYPHFHREQCHHHHPLRFTVAGELLGPSFFFENLDVFGQLLDSFFPIAGGSRDRNRHRHTSSQRQASERSTEARETWRLTSSGLPRRTPPSKCHRNGEFLPLHAAPPHRGAPVLVTMPSWSASHRRCLRWRPPPNSVVGEPLANVPLGRPGARWPCLGHAPCTRAWATWAVFARGPNQQCATLDHFEPTHCWLVFNPFRIGLIVRNESKLRSCV